jgi:hypothetical protein
MGKNLRSHNFVINVVQQVSFCCCKPNTFHECHQNEGSGVTLCYCLVWELEANMRKGKSTTKTRGITVRRRGGKEKRKANLELHAVKSLKFMTSPVLRR